jgi:hypothetical protein
MAVGEIEGNPGLIGRFLGIVFPQEQKGIDGVLVLFAIVHLDGSLEQHMKGRKFFVDHLHLLVLLPELQRITASGDERNHKKDTKDNNELFCHEAHLSCV